MKNTLKYAITALIIASFAITTPNVIASTDSTQYNTLDETKNFLSNVVGLDLTKYSLTDSPYLRNDNSTVAPTITILNETEAASDLNTVPSIYYFESDNGILKVFSTFYGSHLAVVNLKPINDSAYIYANSPGTDLTDQANTFLTTYAGFLATMKNVLSSVNIESSAANTTSGNINFQASKNGNITRLKWIYVDYGIIMDLKSVEMEFEDGNLASFRDKWSLYKVAGPNVLSAEQARKIALDEAQKVPLRIVNEDGEIITLEKHDLSNAPYDVEFYMSACYSSDSTLNSELSLDPLTLYPFWQFHFYFNETIAGTEGIQVGVLGDTGAIYSSGSFGYLGGGYPTDAIDPSTGTSASSATNNFSDLLILAAITTTLILIVSVPIALRRKIRQRK
jgi:hypothetical protein